MKMRNKVLAAGGILAAASGAVVALVATAAPAGATIVITPIIDYIIHGSLFLF
ncbi:MAG TPA: hypothetical protein VHV57_09565 [Acidimicrobiales bacterium]|jgi:hypothetical protein|nr:hypothetical protein [Acidimicrobiales bacterium]